MRVKRRNLLATAAGLLTGVFLSTTAYAGGMSEAKARDLVTPFYQFLSGEVDATAGMANMAEDWRSYASDTKYKVAKETAKSISGLRKHNVTDLNWEIKDLIVANDYIVVRGEGSGTPTKDFFGVPHSGKSFKIMSIDIHQIDSGKIARTWHLENWAAAMRQLSAQ
ncbi:MAG: ester cyclase [Pseudomonadota bacterium]